MTPFLRAQQIPFRRYLLQELSYSGKMKPNHRIEIHITFEGKAIEAGSEIENLEKCPQWDRIVPFCITIALFPEYDPEWLRDRGEAVYRSFGPYKSNLAFSEQWGQKVILDEQHEVLMFLSVEKNEDTT
eukprot:UN14040